MRSTILPLENNIHVDSKDLEVANEPVFNYCYVDGSEDSLTIVTKLSVKDHLDKAFDVLPSNANIDKGRCGIGGTTLEIRAPRHSIFIVCTLGGILGKAKDNPTIFPIYGKMKPKEIVPELSKITGYRKLFVTPDSFWKIIEAAKESIGLDKLYTDFFVLYDESHTAVTEAWRPNVLLPFGWIWHFHHKSFITATPCELNDPNFLALQNYRIEFHEPYVGEVNVLDCKPDEISSCIDAYISYAPSLPGGLFVFYNSVTEIAETIKHNGLTDCHIYCADKGDNYEKLPDQLDVFKREPETGKYAKINFFTTRYFECFDLIAKNATIILVTDITKSNTRVGISNKGVQAIGRIRDLGEADDQPNYIIHITNHRNIHKMKSREQFKQEYHLHKTIIAPYNQYIDKCNTQRITPLKDYQETIKTFSDLNKLTNLATFSQNKLDQVINELVCNEEFNHIDFIVAAWKRCKYNVILERYESIPHLKITPRTSKKNQFKQIIQLIHKLELYGQEYRIGIAAKQLAEIQKKSPLAFETYYKLTIDRIDELKYEPKTIKDELTRLHNIGARKSLIPLLDKEFIVGLDKFYPKNLTDRLQYLYNKVDLRDEKKPDEVLTAKLADFEKNGWFKLKDQREIVNGERVRCYSIIQNLLDKKMKILGLPAAH